MRGADSDHFLVENTNINTEPGARQSIKNSSIHTEYFIQVEDHIELQKAWQQIITFIEKAATEVIGRKKKHPKRKWFNRECEQTLEIKTKKNFTGQEHR